MAVAAARQRLRKNPKSESLLQRPLKGTAKYAKNAKKRRGPFRGDLGSAIASRDPDPWLCFALSRTILTAQIAINIVKAAVHLRILVLRLLSDFGPRISV